MITFTPLAGSAHSAQGGKPFCYLAQVDDVRILLDCGQPDIDAQADWEAYAQAIRTYASTVDLVLLSHSDLLHTGFYPYARARCSLLAPTYATLPVQMLAKQAAMEQSAQLYAERDISKSSLSEYIPPTEQIATAFDTIVPLRYSQPTHLQGRCTGLTITPYNAGHSLGGTIWKIRSPSSGTIIYAVCLNHTRERSLDGTVLLKTGGAVQIFEPLARPDLLITDASRTETICPRKKDREGAFLHVISSTLADRHTVLIPANLDSRLLELLVLLDQHWSFAKLKFPLCLVGKNGENMLVAVRSLMEWFGGMIGAGIVASGVGADSSSGSKRKASEDSPLKLHHIEFFNSPAHLLQTYSSREPKLIIAVPYSMSYGPSRSIFAEHGIGAGEGNLVLLIREGENGTLAHTLWERWEHGQEPEGRATAAKSVGKSIRLSEDVALKVHAKIPLQGEELENFLADEKLVRDREAAQAAVIERGRRLLEADVESDSESETESEEEIEEVDAALATPQNTSQGPAAEPGGRRLKRRRLGDDGTRSSRIPLFNSFELASKSQHYDTYVKGNSLSRPSEMFFKKAATFAHSGTGTAKEKERYKMFPFYDADRGIDLDNDGFGEPIDVGGWLRRGKEIEEENEIESTDARDFNTGVNQNPVLAPEAPSKFISQEVKFMVACNVQYIDLEGLNDGRAVKTILPQVNPHKMILVSSTSGSTQALLASCSNVRGMTQTIYAPADGECVQIGQQMQSFAISLSDDLINSVRMSVFEDSEVGHIIGLVANHPSSAIPMLEVLSTTRRQPVDVAAAEKSLSTSKRLPQSTLVGDLKLTTLKSRLAKLGIVAEFVGEGMLLCSSEEVNAEDMIGWKSDATSQNVVEVVAVKKAGRDRVIVEGPPSETYYIVRQEIYGLHAIVAA